MIDNSQTKLSADEIAQMIDLSAVQANDNDAVIRALVSCAAKYHCRLVTTLPAQTLLARQLLKSVPGIGLAGNVGFPSGGQTTSIKVAEAQELISGGCSELDMVMYISKMLSGKYSEVLADLCAVVETAGNIPVKVIIECHYLSGNEIRKACDLCIAAHTAFVKTSTGWAPSGATLENVALIKRHVGDAIAIKASGGIRSLDTLLAMYNLGARRFGIGLRSAVAILEECQAQPDR